MHSQRNIGTMIGRSPSISGEAQEAIKLLHLYTSVYVMIRHYSHTRRYLAIRLRVRANTVLVSRETVVG